MTPAELVKMVRSIDRQMDESRAEMGDLAQDRSAAVSELLRLVGGTEAAKLLGISREAVYRAARR